MEKRVTLLNICSGMILQICSIISGFVIPHMILLYFGSSVNGLIASLTQFLSYISLLEGGISSVIMANLYKPLIEKNYSKISSTIVAAQKFFETIGAIFVGYTIVLAIVYPLFVNSEFDFVYVLSLTIILSISTFIQYIFCASLRSLLTADKKGYIVSFTHTFIVLMNLFLVYVTIYIYPNIHLLKFISGSLFVIQPIIFRRYAKRKYLIDWKASTNMDMLKERWSGFAINFAAFIHRSTDITVLTIFTNLNTVSVYSVYLLVVNGIKQLIMSVAAGINPSLGQAYAMKDVDELNKKIDLYEYIILTMVYFLFSIAGLLITPFVMIYTKEVVDTDYYKPILGYLLLISEAIYLVKLPHLNLAYGANKFMEVTKHAYIEVIINIVFSILFVNIWGINGVVIATILAMIYRMCFHVFFTGKMIDRKQIIFYKKNALFIIASITGIWFCNSFFAIIDISLYNWIRYGILYTIIFGVIFSIVSVLFFKNELKFLIKYIIK